MDYIDDASPLSADRVDRYLHGMCYHLALHVHELTGWPVVGVADLVPGGHDPEELRMYHAMVRVPDGRLLDGAGLTTDTAVVASFDSVMKRPISPLSDQLVRMGFIRQPPHPGCMIAPTTSGRLRRIVDGRGPRDRQYFGADCHELAIGDAAVLVAWAVRDLGLAAGPRHDPGGPALLLGRR